MSPPIVQTTQSLCSYLGGTSQFADEEPQKGFRAARKTLELDPENPESHGTMASYCYTTGNWLSAEDSFRKSLSLGSALSDHPGYAVLLMCVGNFAKAREILESNIRVDPMNGTVVGYLLAVYEKLGNHESRQEGYRKGKLILMRGKG